jgi:tetratricopeptide (TPR) repeat protein
MTDATAADPTSPSASPAPRLAQTLQHQATQVTDLVGQVVESLLAPPGSSSGTSRRGVRHYLGQVDELRKALEEAGGVLTAWASHSDWEERFGADAWPRRRQSLIDELQRDVEQGSRRWQKAWLAAMAAGAVDEAERLCTSGFRLPPGAVWWPERCLAVTNALRWATAHPSLAAPHFYDLPKVFGDDEEAPVATRVALLTTAARVLARDGDPAARNLLGNARLVALGASAKEERRLQNALLAATSFVERLLKADPPGTAQAPLSDGAPGAASPATALAISTEAARSAASTADDVPWVERLRASAATDLACAVELLQWAAQQPVVIPSDQRGPDPAHGPVADISALVSGLPDVAGLPNRFLALVDEPPKELTVELAARLVQEGQGANASLLLDGVGPAQGGPVDVRAAELRVALAREGVPEGADVVDALVVAAQQALSAGQADKSVAWYNEALRYRQDDPALDRRTAEALIQLAWPMPRAGAEPKLLWALDLCERADRLDPVPVDGWPSTLRQYAHSKLGGFPLENRPEHLWDAVRWSAAAASLEPGDSDAWSRLSNQLIAVGAARVAYRAGRQAACLAPNSAMAREARLLAALNLGRHEEALGILASGPEPDAPTGADAARHVALLGLAHRMAGGYKEALRYLADATTQDDEIVYQYWHAKLLDLTGDQAAAEEAWRAVWRDADIETVTGLEAAGCAALHQGMLTSAAELAARLEKLTAGLMDEVSGPVVRGVAAVLEGSEVRWEVLEAALSSVSARFAIEDLADMIYATLKQVSHAQSRRAQSSDSGGLLRDEDVQRFERLLADRAAAIADRWQDGEVDGPDARAAQRELDWLVERTAALPIAASVAAALVDLRRAMERLDADLDGATQAEAAALEASELEVIEDQDGSPKSMDEVTPREDDRVVRVAVPPRWFSGYEHRELEHPMFKVALPQARAAAATKRVDLEVRVQVRVEEDCGRDQVWLEVPDRPRRVIRVDSDRSYAPESWLPAIVPHRRENADWNADLGLYMVFWPADAHDRLSSWSAEEVVSRRAIGEHLSGLRGEPVEVI